MFAPDRARWFPRTEIPGTTRPNGAHIVEIRGWLTDLGVDENKNPRNPYEDSDPDWHWRLEPDPGWLVQQGVDLGIFVNVGNILFGDQQGTPTLWMAASTPIVAIELNGYRALPDHFGKPPPADWTKTEDRAPNVIWAFQPSQPGGVDLQVGDYVRVVGSLITDAPHNDEPGKWVVERLHTWFGGGAAKEYAAVSRAWEGGRADHDPANPARWTEIHPPDLMERVGGPARRELLRAVAVIARSATFSPRAAVRTIDVVLQPPGARVPHERVGFREYVGPETRPESVLSHVVRPRDDGIYVHVTVRGDRFDGAFGGGPGKFKAVYHLWWEADPGPWTMRASVAPTHVGAGVPATITVSASDADTGSPVAGTVLLDGKGIGQANTSITHTFKMKSEPVWDPGDAHTKGHWTAKIAPNRLVVRAPGYQDAVVELRVP